MKFLQSPWVAAFLGLLLYAGTTVMLWRPAPPPRPEAVKPADESAPSWTFHNPEIESLVAELKQEKATLAERAKQLADLTTRLQIERQEITVITRQVQRLQVEFDRNVVRVREEEVANLKKLAKTYATMSPEGAAAIFAQLDDSSLVKILAGMKDTETAPILETMAKQGEAQAKRAAMLSERLRLVLPAGAAPKRGL